MDAFEKAFVNYKAYSKEVIVAKHRELCPCKEIWIGTRYEALSKITNEAYQKGRSERHTHTLANPCCVRCFNDGKQKGREEAFDDIKASEYHVKNILLENSDILGRAYINWKLVAKIAVKEAIRRAKGDK